MSGLGATVRLRVAAISPLCWLCELPIPQELPGSSRLGATVDHVIAQANGGARKVAANQRPSHRSCNSLKSDAEEVTPELRGRMVEAVRARFATYLRSLSRAQREEFVAQWPEVATP